MDIRLENKILKQLLEWAIECDFGLDNIDDGSVDLTDQEESDLNYFDKLINYIERWLDVNEPG